MKKLIISAFLICMLALQTIAQAPLFEKTKEYNNNFNDVSENDWFAPGIKEVYESGLMDGVSRDTFDTEGTVTIAQGITIAARLHSIYNNKNISDASLENPSWYDKYVVYAIDNKIISADYYTDFNRALKSYEMVNLFDASLPHEYFPAINNVSDLPDVVEGNSYYDSVTRFYNAGILNGNDEYGTFYPASTITRKRAAIIIGRIINKDLRLKYTLKENTQTYSISELYDIIESITETVPDDKTYVMNVSGRNISTATYKRYYKSLKNNYSDLSDDELRKLTLENIAFGETVRVMCESNNIELPYSYVRTLLASYYEYRAILGEEYPEFLEVLNATDKVLCEQEMLTAIYSYALSYLFGYNGTKKATDDEVFKYAIFNDYIRAKHILIMSDTQNAPQLINEIYVKAAKGENFDELIKLYGQDPGMKSSPEGYFFTHGDMVKEFEEAAYALTPGNLSGIVKTDYGYHIIKREVFDMDSFKSSSSFSTVYNECATKKAQDYLTVIQNSLEIKYISSIDDIVAEF